MDPLHAFAVGAGVGACLTLGALLMICAAIEKEVGTECDKVNT